MAELLMCAAIAQAIGLGKNRVEALADGVFATLMTVLVLGLAVPSGQRSLVDRLLAVQGNLLTYAMSFIVLGVFWIGHHNIFHYIRRTDRVFLWLNVLLLMSVGLVPFSTTVLGSNLLRRSAVVLYGVNLTLAGTMLFIIWTYATRHHRLVDSDIDPHFVNAVKQRILIGPAIYIIAIPIAIFLLPVVSVGLYLSALVYFILPGHVDIHFTRKHY
jgi:uncharacterized membrane protein